MPKTTQKLSRKRRWHFTIPKDKVDWKLLKAALKLKCKRWVFQLEKGDETGYLHYQGRMSLKEAKTMSAIKKIDVFKNAHLSIESGSEDHGEFYCTKEETRVKGPWSDKDKEIDPRVLDQWKIDHPTRVQDNIMKILKEQNDRQIAFVYDTQGGAGKTTIMANLEVRNYALSIPPHLTTPEGIGQFVCSAWNEIKEHPDFGRKILYLDIPRAMKTASKWADFFTCLERMKDGFLEDGRFRATRVRVVKPTIIVFANTWPPLSSLSLDRWCAFTVEEGTFGTLQDKYLKKLTIPEMRLARAEQEERFKQQEKLSIDQLKEIVYNTEPDNSWDFNQLGNNIIPDFDDIDLNDINLYPIEQEDEEQEAAEEIFAQSSSEDEEDSENNLMDEFLDQCFESLLPKN